MKKMLFIFLVIALSACTALSPAKSELERNRQKWQAAGIAHYRFSLRIGCFCGFMSQQPLTIEVRDGQVISMLDNSGQPVTAQYKQFYDLYATMDLLFAKAEESLSGGADEVKIEYDPTYGFPTLIALDPIKQAVDDELSLQITNFEALK